MDGLAEGLVRFVLRLFFGFVHRTRLLSSERLRWIAGGSLPREGPIPSEESTYVLRKPSDDRHLRDQYDKVFQSYRDQHQRWSGHTMAMLTINGLMFTAQGVIAKSEGASRDTGVGLPLMGLALGFAGVCVCIVWRFVLRRANQDSKLRGFQMRCLEQWLGMGDYGFFTVGHRNFFKSEWLVRAGEREDRLSRWRGCDLGQYDFTRCCALMLMLLHLVFVVFHLYQSYPDWSSWFVR